MRALITGIRGFVGPYLAAALHREGVEVWGVAHRSDDLEHFPGLPYARVLEGDLCDPQQVRSMLSECAPDQIFHLGGVSDVPTSLRNPRLSFQVNVNGTLNLLESVRELRISSRIVNVSSGLIYGGGGNEDRATEKSAAHGITPYAASKMMGELLACSYTAAFGLEVVTARPFNHIGPRQAQKFVCSDFARQVALISLGRADPVIITGDLDSERDFTDVRDVVQAYCLLARSGQVGEVYNICSSKLARIGDVLAILGELAGLSLEHRVDPAKVRKCETRTLVGDNSKIYQLGWRPKVSLRQTLSDLLQYWISRLKLPE